MNRFRFDFKDTVFALVDGMTPMNVERDLFLTLVLKLLVLDTARHQRRPVESTACLLFKGGGSLSRYIHVGQGLRSYKEAKEFREIMGGEFRYTGLEQEMEAIFKTMAEELGGGRPDRKTLASRVSLVDIPRVVRPRSVLANPRGISVDWAPPTMGEPYRLRS